MMQVGAKRPAIGAFSMQAAQKRSAAGSTTTQPQQRPAVSPVSTPSPGTRLSVLQRAKVRQGSEMSSPPAGELDAGAEVEVLETAVNPNGVVRVKCEAGWVSMATGGGEKLLEPVDEPPAAEEERLLEELMDLYKQKNGKEPTDDVVKQWVATLRDGAGSGAAGPPKAAAAAAAAAAPPKAALPALPTATPRSSPAKKLAAPTSALLGGLPPNLGLTPGPKGDPLGLGQAHLKASDLGLPSFGTQATPHSSPAKPAKHAQTAVPAASAAAAAPAAPAAGHIEEMQALNTQFQAWVGQQLQLPNGPYDLSPGLREYINHADTLREKHASAGPAAAAVPAASAAVAASGAAPATDGGSGAGAFEDAQEKALASKTESQQQTIKNKFKEMMEFMSKGMELLKRDHGEDYEVTPEDIENLKSAWSAVSQM